MIRRIRIEVRLGFLDACVDCRIIAEPTPACPRFDGGQVRAAHEDAADRAGPRSVEHVVEAVATRRHPRRYIERARVAFHVVEQIRHIAAVGRVDQVQVVKARHVLHVVEEVIHRARLVLVGRSDGARVNRHTLDFIQVCRVDAVAARAVVAVLRPRRQRGE